MPVAVCSASSKRLPVSGTTQTLLPFLTLAPNKAVRSLLAATVKVGRWRIFWLIIDLLGTGDFAGATREIDTYARYAEESRQPFFLWYATVARAMRAFVCGQLAESEQLAGLALVIGQRGQVSDAEQFFGLQALQVAYLRGEAGPMIPHVVEFVERFPAIPAWRAVLAALHAVGGRHVDARRELDTLFVDDFANLPRDCNLLVTPAEPLGSRL
ncbi:MAG: hypothetical protein ACI8TX_002520 [Hyphomicrobiaceae bacterium]|jgi:hypothetical protein